VEDRPVLEPRFTDPARAREFLEAQRWPRGSVCPHCGTVNEAYRLAPRFGGRTHARQGLWKCGVCRAQFTVTVNTIFEGSHIPLHQWLVAIDRLSPGRKDIGVRELQRLLGITYKSAWSMAQRIRSAMSQKPAAPGSKGRLEAGAASNPPFWVCKRDKRDGSGATQPIDDA